MSTSIKPTGKNLLKALNNPDTAKITITSKRTPSDSFVNAIKGLGFCSTVTEEDGCFQIRLVRREE